MIAKEHLPYLITEDIYVVPEKTSSANSAQEPTEKYVEPQPQIDPIKTAFAFFHNSEAKDELELLMKIVTACDLQEFQIFSHLDFEKVDFQKAVIFSSSSSNFYEIVNNKVYSQPLSVLKNSQQEKAKLWGVLQKIKG